MSASIGMAQMLPKRFALFFCNYLDLLHYYTKTEEVLRLKQQWQDTSRCPREVRLFHLSMATFLLRLALYPCFYFFRHRIDQSTRFIWGDFVFLFGCSQSLNMVLFVLSAPIPLYYLLLYPYLSTAHYDTIMFPKIQIKQQLALPAKEREPSFQKSFILFQWVGAFFLFIMVLFIVMINIYTAQYVFVEHFDAFFGSAHGVVRFVVLYVNMFHFFLGLFVVTHIFFDMFTSIYYFSIFTFRGLDQCMAFLMRKRLRWSDMRNFRQQHTLLVTRVFRANNFIGSLLLLYFAANYPTNAYILIYIFVERKSSALIKLFLISYMFHQFTYIIAQHLLAASYSGA